MKVISKIEGTAPRLSRRAVELYADNRFKPRVVRSKRLYNRKNRYNKESSHA
jgi:hypothetical protein